MRQPPEQPARACPGQPRQAVPAHDDLHVSTSLPGERRALQGALTAADDQDPAPAEHAEVTCSEVWDASPDELGELGRAACERTYTGSDDDASAATSHRRRARVEKRPECDSTCSTTRSRPENRPLLEPVAVAHEVVERHRTLSGPPISRSNIPSDIVPPCRRCCTPSQLDRRSIPFGISRQKDMGSPKTRCGFRPAPGAMQWPGRTSGADDRDRRCAIAVQRDEADVRALARRLWISSSRSRSE